MKALEVIELTKKFGDLLAVDGITFHVEKGDIFGLLGPNGAGKTTTLRMIYGVLKPTKGTAKVLGVDVVKDPVKARSYMGVLPEDSSVYPRLTAEENLIYFGKLKGMEEGELRRRVRELLEVLDLEDKRYVIADKLSKGQKRKLAFARAVLDKPPLLLLDEPTSGVDVMSAREVRSLIKQYAREGSTIIFSSHNMWEVERLCKTVAIMNKGKIQHLGSVEELKKLSESREFEEVFIKLVRGEVGEAV